MADRGVQIERALARMDEPDFVEVMFARSPDEASSCRSLLEDHGVPARIETDPDEVEDTGVPVLVPAERLEQAAEVLAMRVQDDEEEEEGAAVEDMDDETDDLDDLDDDDDMDTELDDEYVDDDEFIDDDDD